MTSMITIGLAKTGTQSITFSVIKQDDSLRNPDEQSIQNKRYVFNHKYVTIMSMEYPRIFKKEAHIAICIGGYISEMDNVSSSIDFWSTTWRDQVYCEIIDAFNAFKANNYFNGPSEKPLFNSDEILTF